MNMAVGVKPGRSLENRMKLITAFGLAAAFVGVACMAAPVSADEFTPAQKQELGAFIKTYLVNNPEVLREAIEALDKHDKETADAERRKSSPLSRALCSARNIRRPSGTRRAARRWSNSSTTIATICKGALPDVTKLMKDDPNLKLVLKDYPVLGPGSVEAAKVASAARNQLPGDKFWAFHSKLLATHGPIGKTEALAVARELGLDMDKLAKDMESPEVKSGLGEVMQLADALQINGTPTFVVGQDVVVGAVGYDQLRDKVDAVHKCGHATC